MTEPRYLGIDAGGSKTVCVAGDASTILGRGGAGPGNPSTVGVDGFRVAIAAAAQAALRDLPEAPIAVAWLGVAGSQRPALGDELQSVARNALGAARVEISHDARLLLAAAEVDHGIGLVSGTGSSAYGRSMDGTETRKGGWGHLVGDEGSGYDIAIRALRAAAAAIDGRGPQTALARLLGDRLGAPHPAELREHRFPTSVSDIAALAETVLAATEDDAVARGIVDAAADELVTLVDACAADLFDPSAGVAAIPVVLAGGLLGSGSALHRRVAARLTSSSRPYHIVQPRQELAAAALALARAGPSESSAQMSTVSETPANPR